MLLKRFPRTAQLALLLSIVFTTLLSAEEEKRQSSLLLVGPELGRTYVVTINNNRTDAERLIIGADVKWCFTSRSGIWLACVAAEDSDEIRLGNISSEKYVVLDIKQGILPIREQFIGALSPDGDRLLFLDSKDSLISRFADSKPAESGLLNFRPHAVERYTLLMANLKDSRLELIRSSPGPFSPPAWSPDGNRIAYYVGTAESTRDDSFAVEVATYDVIKKLWSSQQIGPPSLLAMRSPTRRRPPKWSSQGGFLLFKARYDVEGPHAKGFSHFAVSPDSGGLIASYDLKIVGEPGQPNGDFIIINKNGNVCAVDFASKCLRRVYSCDPKKRFVNRTYSPDGALFAYSDSKKSIIVAQWDGKNERIVLTIPDGTTMLTPLTWLTINEGKRGESHSD